MTPTFVAPAAPWADTVTMWRYAEVLGVGDGVRYPLPVGGTPLLDGTRLWDGHRTATRLWIKDETRGPTGSNKDRATALVLEHGLRSGLGTITTSSTGNAAVSTAFGAAAVGVRAVIFVSADCDEAKVAAMTLAGAWVFRVRRGYAAATELSKACAARFGWMDRNTGSSPLTLVAKSTVAFEVWEQLGGRAPDVVVAPVGDGPTLVALHEGFEALRRGGFIERVPRLVGVQARGCQPVVTRWSGGDPAGVPSTGTVADGIAVDHPALGDRAVSAVRESGGAMVAVPDERLLEAVGVLAARTGVVAEVAGAACLAGLDAAAGLGAVTPDDEVVLLVTGRNRTGRAGLAPDPRRVVAVGAPDGPWNLESSLDQVAAALAR